jgi:hypothetical protein
VQLLRVSEQWGACPPQNMLAHQCNCHPPSTEH